ncbi:hypothetical protein Tdes44962_MAKER10236 [Teratosphaeria destructans]|uniref:Uncharacterized protein n=1 Tax=Teratosphaeria destructans TaxID=418781 RepID=A0A9W7SMC9_9PEZI|nr:hypothetical protein Tdes44962_MAKER10236 [Teratosphaeria destructans]
MLWLPASSTSAPISSPAYSCPAGACVGASVDAMAVAMATAVNVSSISRQFVVEDGAMIDGQLINRRDVRLRND